MSEVAEKEKRVVILNPQKFKPRGYVRNDCVVVAAVGTTVEDVLDSAYWAHVAPEITQYSRIEVLEESGAWMLDLVVVAVDRTWAKVHLLNKYDLAAPTEMPVALEKYLVEWKGPVRKFAVIRKADSQIIQEGFGSRGDATVWLAGHEKVVAA